VILDIMDLPLPLMVLARQLAPPASPEVTAPPVMQVVASPAQPVIGKIPLTAISARLVQLTARPLLPPKPAPLARLDIRSSMIPHALLVKLDAPNAQLLYLVELANAASASQAITDPLTEFALNAVAMLSATHALMPLLATDARLVSF
jgi:hypothetical protein